jgi:methionyl-tRNA formyltransferase
MMGTGTFALPTFRALLASGHQMAALVTQPDRIGTGHHQHVNPLKELALQAGVAVFQPDRANAPESLERLRSFDADLYVVAAYGQILSGQLLAIPRLGAINLHGSLLPKYRGAAPVQYAVWKGEKESGVTIFQIEPKLDAGPILGMVRTPIGPKETSGELHDRLAELATPLTLEVLKDLEAGTARKSFQDPERVTKAPRLEKEQGRINWTMTSEQIGWHVRGMQPWPMPFTSLQLPGRQPIRILILDVDPVAANGRTEAARPGQILPGEAGEFIVKTGDAAVRVNRLQPAGKRAMEAAEFLRGTPVAGGFFAGE